jgi:pimeloyl-ACP methyl ester carboxylesterase
VALLFAATPALAASDISGVWQGSINPPRVLQIVHRKDGSYRGEINYLGDVGGNLNGNPISITVKGQTVKFSLDRRDGTFEGTLSPDGKSIAGTWQVAGPPAPLMFTRASAEFAIDPSPHKARLVAVEKSVKLEVLDFGGGGGGGPPLIFLPGLGNTAHNFDKFAPNFTAKHHVYAITRRGWGISSVPAPTIANYDADRLGDDVIAVMDALKLERPVVAGHSIAGGELSSIGSRYPQKVAGLIYLDAGYAYAFYTPGGGIPPGMNPLLDAKELKQRLEGLNVPAIRRQEALPLVEALQKSLPQFEKDLAVAQASLKASPSVPPARETEMVKVSDAILGGAHKYTVIKPPVLAIFALPHAVPESAPPAAKSAMQAMDSLAAVHADAFEAGVPAARVVRLPNADHYVFRSNETDVTREMNAFMDGLGK